MTALSGIRRLAFTFGLRPDLGSRIFNTKKTVLNPGSQGPPVVPATYHNRYKDIVLNVAGLSRTDARMLVQVYSAPQFMRENMVSPKTGLMQPYSIAFPYYHNDW
jgi:hypothetical protein